MQTCQTVISLEEHSLRTVLLLWTWWNVRNKADRGEGVRSGEEAAGDVLRMIGELNGKERTVQRRTKPGHWIAPPQDQLKINLDGSFVPDTLQGSWGFVIRDHEGSAVPAGAGNLGSIPDAITAEAAACAKALQEATDHGISRRETDSVLLKQAIQSSSMDFAACGMPSHRDRGSMRRSSSPGTSSQIAEREHAGTAAGTPAELDPAARPRRLLNSTALPRELDAPPRELDRATAPGTEGQATRLHRGKMREAKRKRSAPINQHREGGRPSCLRFIR
jgi:ribonuclease HI